MCVYVHEINIYIQIDIAKQRTLKQVSINYMFNYLLYSI